MANFSNLALTVSGVNALLQAQNGTPLVFSKIGLGSGSTDNSTSLKTLVKTELMLPISEKKIDSDSGHMTIIAKMTNEDIIEGFCWRETGLFFQDSEGRNILFAYTCVTTQYDYIPAYQDQRYIKHIRIADIITDTANITVKEQEGLIYVDTMTFNEFRVESYNSIKTKAEQIELDEHIQDSSIHMTDAEKSKLAGIADKANNYVHPDTHPAGMIVPDAEHRFVTDAEKNKWNATLNNANSYSDINYQQATEYTDEKIAALINGAPTTLDTLKEIADAMEENQNVVTALEESIGKKANESEFDSHVKDKSNPHGVTKAQIGLGSVANERQYSASNPQPSVAGSSGSCTGNAATATKWQTARNINGMSIDGSTNRTNYGTCTTAENTVAKTVMCEGFVLGVGAEVTVRFTYGNTATNPTLNVNNTGAKNIVYRGVYVSPTHIYMEGDTLYTFRYNGQAYEIVGEVGLTHPYYESVDISYSPDAWTDMPLFAGRIHIRGILNQISTMFKNVRWLYRMLGTTDISSIADGTVTGSIKTLYNMSSQIMVVPITNAKALNITSDLSTYFATTYMIIIIIDTRIHDVLIVQGYTNKTTLTVVPDSGVVKLYESTSYPVSSVSAINEGNYCRTKINMVNASSAYRAIVVPLGNNTVKHTANWATS